MSAVNVHRLSVTIVNVHMLPVTIINVSCECPHVTCPQVRTESLECQTMMDSGKSQSHQSRKQLVLMLVGIIVLFFVCLLPFRTIALWETFSPNDGVMQVGAESYLNIIYSCRLLVYVNSAGNPIIYNIVSTKFRRAFLKVIKLYCCGCRSQLTLSRRDTNRTQMTIIFNYNGVKLKSHNTGNIV
jgi:hypothetical protein